MKIAVFGASGFAGMALIERLLRGKDVQVVACSHQLGNAWRLSRACIPNRSVDIMVPDQLARALDGVTHVVNCTRGPEPVMLQGLKTLLAACKTAKVARFVHLSSISVYAPIPPGETMHEDSPTDPEPGSYGAMKLKQDEMVSAAHQAGLDCVVLCPPNISGPFSGFVYKVVSDMRAGTLALLDGGTRPNSTVDVDNLVDAILLALKIGRGDGRRMFVTDGDGHTWKHMTDKLMEIADCTTPLPSLPSEAVPLWTGASKPMPSLWRSFKHLASSEVREALRRDARWARLETRLRGLVDKAGGGVEDRLRDSIEGPQRIAKIPERSPYTSPYVQVQRRGIWHSNDRARDTIGYTPQLTLAAGLDRYVIWYKQMYGFDAPFRPLARAIEAFQAG